MKIPTLSYAAVRPSIKKLHSLFSLHLRLMSQKQMPSIAGLARMMAVISQISSSLWTLTSPHPQARAGVGFFKKPRYNATNLQHLTVIWDTNETTPIHNGLEKHLYFIRALPPLKVKETITLKSFYTQPWLKLLDCKMGQKPLAPDMNASSWQERRHQRGTERLVP